MQRTIAISNPLRSRRRQALLLVGSLITALAIQGALARRAQACGGPEINYGPDKVVTAKHGSQSELRLNFRRRDFHFKGGNLNLNEVRVFTRDRRFAAWLKRTGMANATWKAVKKVGATQHCTALLDGRSILRLERRLAAAVARAYTKATRRAVRRPDVMLVAGVLDGSNPECRP